MKKLILLMTLTGLLTLSPFTPLYVSAEETTQAIHDMGDAHVQQGEQNNFDDSSNEDANEAEYVDEEAYEEAEEVNQQQE